MYTLLMRSNKVETAVQLFRMSGAVLAVFLVMVIQFMIYNIYQSIYIYIYICMKINSISHKIISSGKHVRHT